MLKKNIASNISAENNLRLDDSSASIIEHALVVQACHGTYHAARLLHSKGICISIALRTLARPDLRRRLAQPTLLAPRRYDNVSAVSALMYRHTWT